MIRFKACSESTATKIGAMILGLLAFAAHAEVKLANIFGDHMVLQRQQPISVWGWAKSGDTVEVRLHRQSARARADAQGRWCAVLMAESAGGPYTLEVRGESTLKLQDVLVGDVWLASGQSNMEWSVAQSKDAAIEVAKSGFPKIRHVKIAKTVAFQPAQDIGESVWKRADPGNTGEFSAAAYFFARNVYRKTGVPIGIVNASWGGTNVETWISKGALASLPEFDIASMPSDRTALNNSYHARMSALIARWQVGVPVEAGSTTAWKEVDFDDSTWATLQTPQVWQEQGLAELNGVIWYRRVIDLTPQQAVESSILYLAMVDDCDETMVNGQSVGGLCGWDAPRRYELPAGLLKAGRNVIAVRVTDNAGNGGIWGDSLTLKLQTGVETLPLAGAWKARVENIMDKSQPGPNDLPTLLFNSMVSPLTDFAIKGVIWYQGESNVTRAQQYTKTFPLLIHDWRVHWHQPHLPFYFVQLASFLPLEKNTLTGSDWAELRDAQRQAMKLQQTGMVVATDIGDANSIHPLNKQEVGRRLALLALKNEYGRKHIVASGPVYRSMLVRGSHVEINFSEVGHGLTIPNGQTVLNGFAVAGDDHQFLPAQAHIRGNKVIVSHQKVIQPVAVRYGWVNNPEQINLFNRDGLPASPFRTDNWPGLTDGVAYKF